MSSQFLTAAGSVPLTVTSEGLCTHQDVVAAFAWDSLFDGILDRRVYALLTCGSGFL